MDVWTFLPLLPLLLGSGFFSGAETALFSLPSRSLKGLAQQGGAGALIARLRAEPRPLLVTLLLIGEHLVRQELAEGKDVRAAAQERTVGV